MSEKGTDQIIHEEYEDDFEKDLDWLINEENKAGHIEEHENKNFEALIDKELAEEGADHSGKLKKSKDFDSEDTRNGGQEPPPEIEGSFLKGEKDTAHSDEEVKKYITEKIEQANRQLEDEGPADENRERRLKFKDNLVDLVAPPADYVEGVENEGDRVTGQMSELQISAGSPQRSKDGQSKDSKVLIEKDGKFDLVSLNDIESQGLLPPIPGASSEGEQKQMSPRPLPDGSGADWCPVHGRRVDSDAYSPKPPSFPPSGRPSSAHNIQGTTWKKPSTRRAHSAQSTFALTPEQKEHQKQLEQRRERLRKEEEARKKEEEEIKRQQNEIAFKAWLVRKRSMLQEERRIQMAKEIERINNTEMPDPQEAYKHWLRKKNQQQSKERQIEDIRRQEEENAMYIHGREECERAFKVWLKRKKAEKRSERQTVKDRSRRLLTEARRAKRMRDLFYTISEAKLFKFVNQNGYKY
ncbi:CC181 protein, partial [Polypterus senegalus]